MAKLFSAPEVLRNICSKAAGAVAGEAAEAVAGEAADARPEARKLVLVEYYSCSYLNFPLRAAFLAVRILGIGLAMPSPE